jgi:uncharacterized protein (DUF427 family)
MVALHPRQIRQAPRRNTRCAQLERDHPRRERRHGRRRGQPLLPADSLDRRYVEESATTSVCPWKGTANYYSLVADDNRNPDAVWYYPAPKPEAAEIANRVAFWKGVRVEP